MDTITDSPLKNIIVACGGEEQLIDELLAMEKGEADAATRGQIARLASHLKELARSRNLNVSIGPRVTEVRPQELECDVVRFQNNKEKWVALVGLLDGYPYEIFTGLQDDDEGIMLPKSVTKGKIIKQVSADGTKRYDLQFTNTRGYKVTVEEYVTGGLHCSYANSFKCPTLLRRHRYCRADISSGRAPRRVSTC